MVEAFGTNKQKRALNVRRLNKVCSETLHHTVAKAANTVIEQKGLESKLMLSADLYSQIAAIAA